MLEVLAQQRKSAAPGGDIGDLTFISLDSVNSYSNLAKACGITTGTVTGDNRFLRYFSSGLNKEVLVPIKGVVTDISFDALRSLGLVDGKEITFAGNNYLARFIRGANVGDDGKLPTSGFDYSTYPNNELFAFCEYNKIFCPVVNMSGSSPEGIVYGSQAKYALSEFGFGSATRANSTFCLNYNSNNVLLRGSSNPNFSGQRGRASTSTYWAYRPILIPI